MENKKPLVKVVWIDAVSAEAWDYEKEFLELNPKVIESVSFLLDQNEERILLVQNVEADTMSMAMAIPMSCVEEVIYLEEKENEAT